MNNKQRTVTILSVVLILVLVGSSLFLYGCTWASAKKGTVKTDVSAKQYLSGLNINQETQKNRLGPIRTPTDVAGIKVVFKLDPRITRGQYMGDRWVSPSTYTRVGEGKICTIEAKAYVLDTRGRPLTLSPQWAPSDPNMVTVLPNKGNAVTITVYLTGQSSLRVASEGISKELSIKAVYQNNAIRVDISQ